MSLDLFLIVGPLAVAALAAAAGPAVALGVAAGLLVAGTPWFTALGPSRAWSGGRGRRGLAGPLVAPGIRTLLITIGLAGAALGILRLALVAFSQDQGSPNSVGILLATLGVGSLIGGLWSGTRFWQASAPRRYLVLMASFAVGLLPMAAAGSIPAMAALTVIGGLSLAPVTVCEFLLVRECAPPGTVTEAYAWILTATFGGNALGNALGGVVVSAAGWRAGVLAAAACLATGAAIVAARQGSLGSSVDHTRGAD